MSKINELNAESDSIISQHAGTRNRIQLHLKQLALHTDEHGDIMPIQYFVDQLGRDDAKGLNTKAIGDWLNAFAKVTIKYVATDKRHVVSYAGNKTTIVNTETAKKAGRIYKNWYDFRPTTVTDEYDLQKLLQIQLTKANAQLAKKAKLIAEQEFDEAAKIKVTNEEVASLRTLVEQLTKGPVPEGVKVEEAA